MEYDSSVSMRSVERADVPRPSTDGVRLTAATVTAASGGRSSTSVCRCDCRCCDSRDGSVRPGRNDPSSGKPSGGLPFHPCYGHVAGVRSTGSWAVRSTSAAVPTEAVCILPAPPVRYDAETQAVVSVTDEAVGANLSDVLWPEGLTFFAVVQLAMDQPLLSPEAIMELVAPAPHARERRPGSGPTAAQRQYVLGVITCNIIGTKYL